MRYCTGRFGKINHRKTRGNQLTYPLLKHFWSFKHIIIQLIWLKSLCISTNILHRISASEDMTTSWVWHYNVILSMATVNLWPLGKLWECLCEYSGWTSVCCNATILCKVIILEEIYSASGNHVPMEQDFQMQNIYLLQTLPISQFKPVTHLPVTSPALAFCCGLRRMDSLEVAHNNEWLAKP